MTVQAGGMPELKLAGGLLQIHYAAACGLAARMRIAIRSR
jgi:hypothetical protein